MTTVLVSGAGSVCGIGVIQTIQESTDNCVIAVDMDSTAAGLYEADDGFIVPAAVDDQWPQEMARVIDAAAVDAVVLTLDAELRRIADLRRAVDASVEFVSPREPVIDLSVDKHLMARQFNEADLSTPPTWLGTEFESIPSTAFPVVVKPRYGQGNASFEQWESQDAVVEAIDTYDCPADELIVQKFVAGTEYTTSVVGTRDDRLLAVVPKEAVGNDQRVTRIAENIVESCRAIHDEFEPRGPLNVQHIVNKDGTPYVFEMNPRFSTSSSLTAAAGVNEYNLLIRDALGKTVETPSGFETGYRQVKYRNQYCLPDSAMFE